VRFADIPGWGADEPAEALAAFVRSCERILRRDDAEALGPEARLGTVGQWRPACREAAGAAPASARDFFERLFRPLAVTGQGLMTGYYEPELRGSRRRQDGFLQPLYKLPEDLVQVDLGQFRPDWRGQRTAGRVQGGRLVPYADRAAIGRGALAGRGLELAWVEDPVAAFFLHIQGSGRVVLEDGQVLRVGFAGQNGHPYVAIGAKLIERGVLTRETTSMQSIAAWLRANPAEAQAVMNQNPSYVFFRALDGAGPLGAQGVALIPGRSLAVDSKHWAYGLPVFVDGARPTVDGTGEVPFRRLMIAQDTGGAIRGVVRGDVFWGPGQEAEAIAGRMRHQARWYVLVPLQVPLPNTSS